MEGSAVTLGSEWADAMMDLLPPAGWGDLVRQRYVEAEFKSLRGEMAELRAEFKVLEGKVDSQGAGGPSTATRLTSA